MDNVERTALKIGEFCERNGISRSLFYILRRSGRGPRELRVGATGKRISIEAERDWQRAQEVATSAPASSPDAGADFAELAKPVVQSFQSAKRIVPGIGHPFHKPVDPRAPRLVQIARDTGFDGPYLKLMAAIADEASRASAKVLPMNATGAIGALCCEMGFNWKICRGLGVMARAVGLVGHILEESRNPMAEEVWHMVDEQATAHLRPTHNKE